MSTTQVFGRPTFDSAFKYVMDDEKVLLEFVSVFAKVEGVKEVTPLDTSLNPIKGLMNARAVVNSTDLNDLLKTILKAKTIDLSYTDFGGNTYVVNSQALRDLSNVFEDIKGAFPSLERDSRMDLLCRLNNGDLIVVEVQVVTQKFWDKRPLAYCAGTYAHQLRRGDKWEDLRKVVAVNLLGKGLDDEDPWKDSPDEFCRHYKFVTEGRSPSRVIEHMQLIQYCIPHLKKGLPTISEDQQKTRFSEWADFFQTAHLRTEEDIVKLTSDAVKRAYKRARISDFPEFVKSAYNKEEQKYNEYAEAIKKAKDDAAKAAEKAEDAVKAAEDAVKAAAKAEEDAAKAVAKASNQLRHAAKAMLTAGVQVEVVMSSFGLSLDEVSALRETH